MKTAHLKYFDSILGKENTIAMKKVNKSHWKLSDDTGWSKVLKADETRRLIKNLTSDIKHWTIS